MDYVSDRNFGCRITEYFHRSIKHVCLENDKIRLTILPDKGCDITQISSKCDDLNFIWTDAPGGGVRNTAKHIRTTVSGLGNNLDYYEGGWHEAFPGGGPYTDGGMSQGLHGEACLVPWRFSILVDKEDEISVGFSCETVRFPARLEKRITIKREINLILFDEKITNLSNEDLDYMWGQHPVIGKPFLSEETVFEIDAQNFEVCDGFNDSKTSYFTGGEKHPWPIGLGKDGQGHDMSKMSKKGEKNAELLFLSGINDGKIKAVNKKLGYSFNMRFDKELFKCIWYWRVLEGTKEYPWYSKVYCLGLEFWTGYPNFDGARKNGTINVLKAKGSVETSFEVEIEKI
jgi:hypothetical protein